VQNVTSGAKLLIPSTPRVIISKSVYQFVPDRREARDQQGFAQRNTNVVDDEIAARKISNL
jgi:hypothetical protein